MSLPDIEKNDVDLSQLFNYTTELELQLPDGGSVTVYQRVIGDEDNGKAQVHALRESAAFREKLADKKWKDRIAYIPKISIYKKDEIVNVILSMMLRDLTMQAINEVTIKQLPELDEDATLEEREEHQKKVDEYPSVYNKEVEAIVVAKREVERKKLNAFTRDELLSMYETTLINSHVQQVYDKEYTEISTFFGSFLNPEFTKHAYKTLEAFENAPGRIKAELIKSYKTLELSSLALKK